MMHFAPEPIRATHYIQQYEPGCVTINQKAFHHSVVLIDDQLMSWDVPDFSSLTQAKLASLLDYGADVILLGTGEHQHFLPPPLLKYITEKRRALDVMSSRAAASTYNLLAQESRRPLLALMIR